MSLRRALAVTVSLSVSAVLVVGCTSAPASQPTPHTSTPDSSPSATSAPTPTQTAIAAPTCENLVLPSLVEQFEAHDWTAKRDVFRVGNLTIDDGLECVWGDASVASDRVQVFGWAPISDADAATARSQLIAAGWKTVADTSGDFLTEDPTKALAKDSDGYGLTYQFGDGWILLADTKQSLLLIQRPEG